MVLGQLIYYRQLARV